MPLPFQPIWLEAVTGLLHHSARENSFSYTHLPVWENSPQVLLFIKFQSSPLLHKILLTPGAKYVASRNISNVKYFSPLSQVMPGHNIALSQSNTFIKILIEQI